MNQKLLSRYEFAELVFARSRGCCVFCKSPAVDPHHILERKLFRDGGYYVNNGAALCNTHHWKCETTEISVKDVRLAAGITHQIIPDGWRRELNYDKWGNVIRVDGLIEPGPLFHDTGCQKALKASGAIARVVYPKNNGVES